VPGDWAGRRVTKRALVQTNDPDHEKFFLSMSVVVAEQSGQSPLSSPQPLSNAGGDDIFRLN
jgi:hypothetical protein